MVGVRVVGVRVVGDGGGQGCLGGVSRCHSIDWLPKLWLLHFISSSGLLPALEK